MDFDTRANVLSLEIKETWEPEVQEVNRQNQDRIRAGLAGEFGQIDIEAKINNFVALGPAPVSILAFHNKFLRQIRYAFVIGSYYPALTGTCALGERILNHLILNLRDYHKSTQEYKKVYDKESIADWHQAIETLRRWQVLLPEVIEGYRELAEVRHQKAIHFDPETDYNDRELALEAIQLLSRIIQTQFPAFGSPHWFIPEIPEESFIKKGVEEQPFIRIIYIPKCWLVGPYHQVNAEVDKAADTVRWTYVDDYEYPSREISDREFAELFKNRVSQGSDNTA